MSVTVPRSFRVPKPIDDAISDLMKEEARSRNNIVDILLEEAITARRLKGKRPIKKKKLVANS